MAAARKRSLSQKGKEKTAERVEERRESWKAEEYQLFQDLEGNEGEPLGLPANRGRLLEKEKTLSATGRELLTAESIDRDLVNESWPMEGERSLEDSRDEPVWETGGGGAVSSNGENWSKAGKLLSGSRNSESLPEWERENSSVQSFLKWAETESRRVNQSSLGIQRKMALDYLKARGIPLFYYQYQAEREGIERGICRSWNFLKLEKVSEEHLNPLTLVVIGLQLRMLKHPEPFSYEQAMEELQKDVKHLEGDGYTQNQISQHLQTAHRTVRAITRWKSGEIIRNHCPWELREKLKGAAAAIDRERVQNEARHQQAKELGIIPGDDDRGEPELEVKPEMRQRTLNVVDLNSPCWRCRAEATARHYEESSWYGDMNYHEYQCYQCGRENLVEPPVIDLYQACGNCSAPYHALQGHRKDGKGRAVKVCRICRRSCMVIDQRKAKGSLRK